MGISYFLVVFVDDRFHVVHTAVANFDVILVFMFVCKVMLSPSPSYVKYRQT